MKLLLIVHIVDRLRNIGFFLGCMSDSVYEAILVTSCCLWIYGAGNSSDDLTTDWCSTYSFPCMVQSLSDGR
jgi:hypothetical protein